MPARPAAPDRHLPPQPGLATQPSLAGGRPTAGRRRSLLPLALLTVAALALAACSASSAPATGSTAEGPSAGGTTHQPGTSTSATTYPLTLDSCGFEVTVDAPPQRVLTVKSSTTEMLLALGLADKVAATAFLDGPVPE